MIVMANTMRVYTVILGCLVSAPAAAAEFNGSQPFLCASFELYSCVVGSECQTETAQSINAPQFLYIDAQKKEVTGLRPNGEVMGSTTDTSNDTPNDTSKLNLHGIEGEFAWNITVERAGKMMLVAGGNVDGDQTALIIYGACTFVPPQGPQ
jgi:hypothetical protein